MPVPVIEDALYSGMDRRQWFDGQVLTSLLDTSHGCLEKIVAPSSQPAHL